MPAVSKKQQKFMGIVHAIQKGEADPSDYSEKAQDAAKKMKKKSAKDYAKTKHKGLPVRKEERDYKDEYKKFQSSTKAKKYRAELNKYNRKKGTYGNNDGKDASHKGGKIAGFEAESKNRGRAEKSRLKKENFISKIIDEVIDEYQLNEGTSQMTQVYKDLDKKFKTYDHTGIRDFNKVSKYLKTKFSKGSGLPDAIASFYNDYKGGEDMKKNINRLTNYAKKMKGYKKESVNETKQIAMFTQTFDKLLKKQTKGKQPTLKDLERVYDLMRKHYGELSDNTHKSVKESDLGLTYKKGKTVKVTHNKSGKEIVIIDKPNVRKEYEKIGFFAEGSCGYGIGGKVGDEPAGPHLLKRKKKDMKEAKTVSIDGEELLNFLMKRFKYSKKQAIATMKKHKMDTSFLKKESVNEWKMNTNLKKDKNDSPQIKKVKKVAKKVGKKLGAKGYEESVNEGDKKKYWDAYAKYYKTYEAFAREVMNLAKSATKISGEKTDEKIILKNFKKQVIPFAGLMSSWSKGHEKNPHISEAISKEEWAQYPAYARKLKPYMQKLLKVPLKVRVIKQANHNPWIEIRVAKFGKDVIPNDFRLKAAKAIGATSIRDKSNVNYGNIRSNSVSLKHDQWVKLLGNKVKV